MIILVQYKEYKGKLKIIFDIYTCINDKYYFYIPCTCRHSVR